MALVRKKNYKKMVVYAVILVIMIIVGVYFLINSTANPANTNTGVGSIPTGYLPIVSDYGQDLFTDRDYQDLEDFAGSKLPLDPDSIQKGRENPFK
ncbi:MAG: hypothetical protein WC528_01170 [Patescibacteria group bacterium]